MDNATRKITGMATRDCAEAVSTNLVSYAGTIRIRYDGFTTAISAPLGRTGHPDKMRISLRIGVQLGNDFSHSEIGMRILNQ